MYPVLWNVYAEKKSYLILFKAYGPNFPTYFVAHCTYYVIQTANKISSASQVILVFFI